MPYRACTGKGEARLGMDIKFQSGKALGGIDCIISFKAMNSLKCTSHPVFLF
jgi:hypothetical protein